jgi:alpha-ketoglutarate-dependent taurine dioxygenase
MTNVSSFSPPSCSAFENEGTRVPVVMAQASRRDVLAEGRALLDHYGVVLFRGFANTERDFEVFSHEFCKDFVVHGNVYRPFVSTDGFTQQVDAGKHPLPAHSEMSYTPFYPDSLWFYCSVPPVEAGQTTVCDGQLALQRLPRAVRQELEDRRVRYHHCYGPQVWRRALGVQTMLEASNRVAAMVRRFPKRGELVCTFDDDELLHMQYTASAITQTRTGSDAFVNSVAISFLPNVIAMRGGGVAFEDGSEIPPELLDAINESVEGCEALIEWRAGDQLLIDNTRVMHGRRRIVDDERRIFVRLGMLNA